MPTRKTSKFPPPKSWEEFEQLCSDLFRRVWNDEGTQLHGRQGQPQHGVDVVGRPNGGTSYADVQAKNTEAVSAVTLRHEVAKAKDFVPKLERFILATTAHSDRAIQMEARLLTEEHSAVGLFSGEVWSWDDIESRIAEYPELQDQYYADFMPSKRQELAGTEDLAHAMREQLKWDEERDRPTFERTSGSVTGLVGRFEPSWRIRQASGDYLPNLK